MSLKAGIVGLPNVGKSTLFSALTLNEAESANYAFTTIEPNVAIVNLNDTRLEKLAKIVNTNKIVPATFQFVDIAGLVEGASKGEGLGNKFLANIREVDAIIHVVRCFENNDIVHVKNQINPLADLKIINLELILADLQTIENVINRIGKKAQNSADKDLKKEYAVALKIREALANEKMIKDLELSDDEKEIIKSYQLLSLKPTIYVANLDYDSFKNLNNAHHYQNLKTHLDQNSEILIPVNVKVEYELSQFDKDEKATFLAEYNIEESGLDQIIRKSFYLLNQATYFTAGEIEARAWVFKKGQNAAECAGIIHTDFEKKFVKAEVIKYDDYVSYGGEKECRKAGKIALEGRNYLMQDGDVCYFKIAK
ncbi:GTP-binding and nucleic acid-binding protein YchF [Metamycoplasma arthritidis]|uniref:Ribosome-binding ATPase YchF n=1 Tax=Metamycoplasma arthritidis (strain 158L3-1) TaxID=243272 RepID=B3PM42_META1|nr:redox-regulated ATPase YchF [Metamycoplasma arthritidis]ACF07094.1 putative GTPase translation factor [Metamycoplasma arthritidis 158L3-1]VEU78622.1 GTP-binding and nucleic acid-binding protein YchF [Metamycoplasma arthritidis]